MDLDAYLELGEWAVQSFPVSVLREGCRKPGEDNIALDARLLRSGWKPTALSSAFQESLQPGSAALIRSQAGNIAREIRKLGQRDPEGQPARPNWDLVAMSFWRAMDRWVSDSTRDASFLGRLWKKLSLQDSVQETTTSVAAAGMPKPLGGRVTKAELRALFPGADEEQLEQIYPIYGLESSRSPTRSRVLS